MNAGLSVLETVSPFSPGSVLTISLLTKFGGSILRTSPFQKRILHSSSPSSQSLTSTSLSKGTSICSKLT